MLDFGPYEKLMRESFMKETVAYIFGLVFGAIAFMLVLAWPIMWIWNNALAPAVTVFNTVDYWQALQILVICRVLFAHYGSVRGKG